MCHVEVARRRNEERLQRLAERLRVAARKGLENVVQIVANDRGALDWPENIVLENLAKFAVREGESRLPVIVRP